MLVTLDVLAVIVELTSSQERVELSLQMHQADSTCALIGIDQPAEIRHSEAVINAFKLGTSHTLQVTVPLNSLPCSSTVHASHGQAYTHAVRESPDRGGGGQPTLLSPSVVRWS